MTRWLLVFAMAAVHLTASAATQEEQALLAVLGSDRSAAEKDQVCQRLKHIGTVAAVPALASLLVDEQLSHSARYALESIPGPEADAAFRDALAKAKGAARLGIIDSLGDRRDREAVPLLGALLGDGEMGESAARALGKIGGPQAVSALDGALSKATGNVRQAIFDGLLRCAEGLSTHDAQAARAVYAKLQADKTPEHVRMAAFRGAALAADDPAGAVVGLLKGSDPAARLVGLQLVGRIEGGAATKAFAGVLGSVEPAVQVALLQALRQRRDTLAAGAVAAIVASESEIVRVAALQALAAVGDASTVPLLAERAAAGKGAEKEAARLALARLGGEDVRGAILAQLAKAGPAAQQELADALGRRQEPEAVPALLRMAGGTDPASRLAAARSLALLADETMAPKLVQLVLKAKEEGERTALEKALSASCERSKVPQALAGPLASAANGADVAARCTLLRVLARIGGDTACEALRAGVKDADVEARDASIRAMAEFGGGEVAQDLLALAREAPSQALQVLALRGYWRVVAGATSAARLAMCEAGLAASTRPEEKKLGLTQLATVPDPKALALAGALAKEPAVRAEAEAACVQIAASMVGSHPSEAKAALLGIKAGSKDPRIQGEAAKALDSMQRYVGYITAWQVAGPYRQEGKECQQLFDIAFDPEKPDAKVTWKPAPAPGDPSLVWKVDLSSVVGGNHCVVYVRSKVYAPAKQTVRLDMGADDGIKVWVNGKLVHANNAIRGLTPEQDKATAALEAGWNDFLVKITQHTMGCEACIRIRRPDGSVIDGLLSAAEEPQAAR